MKWLCLLTASTNYALSMSKSKIKNETTLEECSLTPELPNTQTCIWIGIIQLTASISAAQMCTLLMSFHIICMLKLTTHTKRELLGGEDSFVWEAACSQESLSSIQMVWLPTLLIRVHVPVFESTICHAGWWMTMDMCTLCQN